jgi:hypothetical protein
MYDVIAGGYQGRCFAMLARRFMISEYQAAEATRGLLPVIAAPFEAWIESPQGLRDFLAALSRGGYETALTNASILNNQFERDRGQQLLETFRSAREIDGENLARACETSGLPYRTLLQMLPFVVLFVMAAMRSRLEAPVREVLANRLGRSGERSADPFADLADVIAWESKGRRQSVLSGLFGGLLPTRQPAIADSDAAVAAA